MKGSQVTRIRSELYSRESLVIPEGEAERILQTLPSVDAVYLYDISPDLREKLVLQCAYLGIAVVYTLNKADALLGIGKHALNDLDMPVIYRKPSGIFGKQGAIKRFFDVFLSLVALVLLSPLMALIAICIKLGDGGPILHKQERYTSGGRIFEILKFRSMIPNAEDSCGPVFASYQDRRLTKVGRVLRNSKLDELPQLINIIRGDMSLVGPRPERPELMGLAYAAEEDFDLRLKVRAGLTGLAQVRGIYHTGFQDKLKWDLLYIENFSLLLDIKIMLMTVFSIFNKDNVEEPAGLVAAGNIEDAEGDTMTHGEGFR